MTIRENMLWPPVEPVIRNKMCEHSAWYAGDTGRLADFYSLSLGSERFTTNNLFWGRQTKNEGEICVHVPVASDIAETSANFLFGESPLIKLIPYSGDRTEFLKQSQAELDKMLVHSGFFRKIVEAAEVCSALGGAFVKLAWDASLSDFPIPVIVQPDNAIPTFSFGMLKEVIFWREIIKSKETETTYRLLETYSNGGIKYDLYEGTPDRLGKKVSLLTLDDTKDMPNFVETPDILCTAYIPNMLPNRLNRTSYLGRSDYLGAESMMDSLDMTYSFWMREITLGMGRVFIPEPYLAKSDSGSSKFNVDKMMYAKLDVDPTVNSEITVAQFNIRADEFEKTCLSLLERIIVSAGYSPQSFGLNIEGRAESGTALGIRERKSFATKAKKEQYWQPALTHLIKAMIAIYNENLGGKLESNCDINISFSDGIANNITEMSTAIKMLSDAQATSIETKVRMLHPEWEEEQILAEVKRIKEEQSIGQYGSVYNPDTFQIDEDDDEE